MFRILVSTYRRAFYRSVQVLCRATKERSTVPFLPYTAGPEAGALNLENAMLPSRRKTVVLLTLVALVPFLACSDTTEPENGDTPAFTGSYTLVSIAQGTAAGVIDIPGSTGSATLTATNYEVSLTLPQLPPALPITIDDEGTYSAMGSATAGSWSQQSSLDVNLQYSGTYTYDTATEQLTLDTTATGIRTVLVLQKT